MTIVHAALITGRETVELREFADPVPAPGGVVVDIAYCGICGTDVHAYQSGQPYAPAICGHEWTGTVSEIGQDVASVNEGDRVTVAVARACGACAPCRAGHEAYCETTFTMMIGRDELAPPHGGFAPRLAVAETRVVATDPGLTDIQAAQVEPMTVTYHAVNGSELRVGDTAVVQGAGPIGLGVLQFARAAGAGEVVVVEPDEMRRSLALKLGAAAAVAPGAEAQELIGERSHGLGADIVFECVGRPAAVQSAVDLARRGGSMCLVGFTEGQAEITPAMWLFKEIRTTAALAYLHDEFETVMGMMADGTIRADPIHTSTVGLGGLEEAIADLAAGGSSQVKVLVDPNG
jgi:(R,R)-butanediol dehydrogenase/meso-butanediol dehydrogenase/diacetyl reductase